ncbi:D-alanyl-D-alanine endopeptidase [Noviherbaspirillum pedocola]|uniref:D-alanyl-D-alanine endopeptidase n=1 Tax=Noviherbaspirillum pedocola TaxID=2801341 RepID=A0A934SWC8_9BURK|nr:D-alanyl-D-alanine endopeptidase [Noviherbaspirillum pedocola]MBK4736972.1 D-alanyl-D-alanine endopeptidase [Noviherbaspirillum pedocola]
MAKAALIFLVSSSLILGVLPPALAKSASKHSAKHTEKHSAKSSGNKAAPRRRVHVNVATRHHSSRHAALPRLVATPAVPVVPAVRTAGDMAGLNLTHDPLALGSNAALVIDQQTSEVLFEKNADVALPIASLTKLMTSMVVVESNQSMDEMLTVTEEDVDREKFSRSRLRVGSQLSRANMLHIALMSSENRAASALGRNYPGGLPAFVAAMNTKARSLGMANAHYVEPTGLSSNNVASARDLAKLVVAASRHPVIRQYSTDSKYAVEPGGPILQYRNSNHLVDSPTWEIGLQKTGYITEAGHCLVMQSRIDNRPVVMVFLDSKGKNTRLADAGRIRKWIETTHPWSMNRTLTAHN